MVRFSIRDLLLVTVIAAIALGWWIDRSRLAPRAAESDAWKFRAVSLAERVQPNGWQVKWDEDEIFITQIAEDGKRRVVRRQMNPKPVSQAEMDAVRAALPAGYKGPMPAVRR